jgi:hypothetical protein
VRLSNFFQSRAPSAAGSLISYVDEPIKLFSLCGRLPTAGHRRATDARHFVDGGPSARVGFLVTQTTFSVVYLYLPGLRHDILGGNSSAKSCHLEISKHENKTGLRARATENNAGLAIAERVPRPSGLPRRRLSVTTGGECFAP